MEIKRGGSQPSRKGPVETGSPARCASIRCSRRTDPARASGASVTFEPGARTRLAHASARPDADRHRGLRLGAARGRPGRGDPAGRRGLVPPGEKHWHGATPTTAMTHIAIQETLDGKVVDWMEKVSDDQYPNF